MLVLPSLTLRQRMLPDRLEKITLSSRADGVTPSLAAFTCERYHEIRVLARSCNILYMWFKQFVLLHNFSSEYQEKYRLGFSTLRRRIFKTEALFNR